LSCIFLAFAVRFRHTTKPRSPVVKEELKDVAPC
jgi:hypothetical protein